MNHFLENVNAETNKALALLISKCIVLQNLKKFYIASSITLYIISFPVNQRKNNFRDK